MQKKSERGNAGVLSAKRKTEGKSSGMEFFFLFNSLTRNKNLKKRNHPRNIFVTLWHIFRLLFTPCDGFFVSLKLLQQFYEMKFIFFAFLTENE